MGLLDVAVRAGSEQDFLEPSSGQELHAEDAGNARIDVEHADRQIGPNQIDILLRTDRQGLDFEDRHDDFTANPPDGQLHDLFLVERAVAVPIKPQREGDRPADDR